MREILERNILQAFQMFGCLNIPELKEKLKLRKIDFRPNEVENVLVELMMVQKKIEHASGFNKLLTYKLRSKLK